ncbi:MAG: hypothetical protein HY687_02855 [Chloroflexi bacterium]|nr:hypothetical protein [Chloroflexota bacterium]
MFVGSVLVVVGVIALLVNMGVLTLTGSLWGYVWPSLLIIIGLSFLTRRNRRSHWFRGPWREGPEDKDK